MAGSTPPQVPISISLPTAATPLLHPPLRTNKKSHARRQPAGHIPRPRNAFILFRCDFVAQQRVPVDVENDHRNISRIAGSVWREMSDAEKDPWVRLAEQERQAHGEAYPGYRYNPMPRGAAKKGGGEEERGRESQMGETRKGRRKRIRVNIDADLKQRMIIRRRTSSCPHPNDIPPPRQQTLAQPQVTIYPPLPLLRRSSSCPPGTPRTPSTTTSHTHPTTISRLLTTRDDLAQGPGHLLHYSGASITRGYALHTPPAPLQRPAYNALEGGAGSAGSVPGELGGRRGTRAGMQWDVPLDVYQQYPRQDWGASLGWGWEEREIDIEYLGLTRHDLEALISPTTTTAAALSSTLPLPDSTYMYANAHTSDAPPPPHFTNPFQSRTADIPLTPPGHFPSGTHVPVSVAPTSATPSPLLGLSSSPLPSLAAAELLQPTLPPLSSLKLDLGLGLDSDLSLASDLNYYYPSYPPFPDYSYKHEHEHEYGGPRIHTPHATINANTNADAGVADTEEDVYIGEDRGGDNADTGAELDGRSLVHLFPRMSLDDGGVMLGQ